MIYLLEGPDGVGKTTLAKEIASQKGAHIIHSSYNKYWDIKKYHEMIIKQALDFNEKGIPVVLDRWVVSEFVYGTVFRGGPSYDTSALLEKYIDKITPIYCWNENAVENHLKNRQDRIEMFESMADIVKEFEDYINFTSNNWLNIPWVHYNYNQIDVKEFVKELK